VVYVHAAADALPERAGGFDAVVSGLVLNFVPEPERALATLRGRARPGGVVAAYVWDYAGGIQFLEHFWKEAVALDPAAAELDEARRFGAWQRPALEALFRGAGLERVESSALEIATEFEDFEDFWRPFLGGTGPGPSYVAALDASRREELRAGLERRLSARAGEPIRLRARASAVKGRVPEDES
jgi:SAM-dependent methyltransferase